MRGIQPDEEGLLHADAVELPGAVQYEGTGTAGDVLGVIDVEAKVHSFEVVSSEGNLLDALLERLADDAPEAAGFEAREEDGVVLLSARGSVAKGLVQKEVQRASEIQPEWPVAID